MKKKQAGPVLPQPKSAAPTRLEDMNRGRGTPRFDPEKGPENKGSGKQK